MTSFKFKKNDILIFFDSSILVDYKNLKNFLERVSSLIQIDRSKNIRFFTSYIVYEETRTNLRDKKLKEEISRDKCKDECKDEWPIVFEQANRNSKKEIERITDLFLAKKLELEIVNLDLEQYQKTVDKYFAWEGSFH